MKESVVKYHVLLPAILLLGIFAGCGFVGTPKERILRTGGRIEPLEEGGTAVVLSGSRIVDNHMMAVTAFSSNHPECEPIRKLDISGSRVSDVGLETLSELKSLEALDVRRTKVTGTGIEKFQDKVPNCRIKRD